MIVYVEILCVERVGAKLTVCAGPVRQLRGAARAGARRGRGPLAARGRRARQGAAAVAAQVRVQRGGEVRVARHAQRARATHRRALRLQRQVRAAIRLSHVAYCTTIFTTFIFLLIILYAHLRLEQCSFTISYYN